jgi:hypothetical protein
MSEAYVEAARHFARILVAEVQGKVVSNLLSLADMEIGEDEKDVGKKLAVKADVNKFLATRFFEKSGQQTDDADRPAPITIVYNMTPDAPQEAEADLVYIDAED